MMKRIVAITAMLSALIACGEITRSTEWQDIPDGTRVSNVVDLAVGRAVERDPFVAVTNRTIYIHGTALNEADPVWSAEKSAYETTAHAAGTYQVKGNYLTTESDPTTAPWAKVGQQKPTTSLAPATNYTDAVVGALKILSTNDVAGVVSNTVTKAYVEDLGISGSTGVDTNAVNSLVRSYDSTNLTARIAAKQDIITDYTATNAVRALADVRITNAVERGYLCTKAAAVAMTNALPNWTKSATKPTYTASEVGALPASQEGDVFYLDSGCFILVGRDTFFGCDKLIGGGWVDYPTIGGDFRIDMNSRPSQLDADNIARIGDIPDTSSFATRASVVAVSNEVAQWETYWRGDRVRLSVTNYYGNTSGELPRLRIEEFDHSVTNGNVVSNVFKVVWDEEARHTNYQAQTDAKVDAISNTVMTAAWKQTNLQLANKAPRAWQSVTSAGEAAPENCVWHTAPNTVFAGGTEYAHVAVGEGTICVLVDRGAPVFTEGEEGKFRFTDSTGSCYFGFDIRDKYEIGCRTDGISVDSANHLVSLTYDLTSATTPTIMYSTNLVDWVDKPVTWEQNPPAGTQMCYIDVGTVPQGFFKAEFRYASSSKFITNMMADLAGGIAATNETGVGTASQLPIYPAVTPTGIVWRVKQ